MGVGRGVPKCVWAGYNSFGCVLARFVVVVTYHSISSLDFPSLPLSPKKGEAGQGSI